MTRLPGAIFVVDIVRENIAVKEAQKLNIPIFAMVDTNSDPRGIQYIVPSNDDASKSISKIVEYISDSIQTGLEERKSEKEAEEAEAAAAEEAKKAAAEEKEKAAAEEKEKAAAKEKGKVAAEETKKGDNK